ncbi:MAG: CBS domain-containing protein, partial [Bacteroidota bacterium]
MNTSAPLKKIMNSQFISVAVDTSWKDVNAIFEQHQLRHLLVVDHQGKLAGIISRTDRLKMLKKLLNRSSGKTWMTREEEATQAKNLM